MKTLTCTQCDYVSRGSTEKEVMDDLAMHVEKAHPDMAKKSMNMPKKEQDKMMEDTKKRIMDDGMM